MSKPIVALIYDFDKTLASDDMQAFDFIPNLGLTSEEFWAKTSQFQKDHDTDRILSFLYVMIDECKKHNIKLTREYLRECAKRIKYYDGVSTWFNRINNYGREKGLEIEHYIISCGNKEIIEGSSIAKEFKKIFGCEFLYDENTNEAYWPKTMINFTQKTQYIFRINKGDIESNDDSKINEKQKIKRIKLKNMIYLGDGLTDVPSMIVVKENGGNSIAVYPNNKLDKVGSLYNGERVNLITKADYSANSDLEKKIKLIIDSIAISSLLEDEKEEIDKEINK